MARRNNNKMTRMRKIEPSQLTLTFSGFSVGEGAQSATKYIDLSQVNSLVNRRFYRQGLNYGVAGIRVLTGTGYQGIVSCSKLPTTWVMSNAWHKSFAVWQRMNKEALEESESVRPRFLDFKIYADQDHHAAGFAANLIPISTGSGTPPSLPVATVGEWESSKIIVPDTSQGATGGVQDFEFIAVGANYPGAGASGLNAVSLVEGYAASRLLPNVLDPNVPADADETDGPTPANWMSATFNEGTQQVEEVLTDMINENNIAPYPFENDGVNIDTMYPGGANQLNGLELHSFELVSATTIGGQTRIKGGAFPCGLMRFDFTSSGPPAPVIIVIDLVPGDHRGLLAESMQEM